MAEIYDPPTQEHKDAEAAFNRTLPTAMALAPSTVIAFGADAHLALHNVRQGLAAVRPRLDEIKPVLKADDIQRIAELDELALALVFAASAVNRLLVRSNGEINEKLQRAHMVRRVLLLAAEASAEAELVPAPEVEEIRRGQGNLDPAQDCLDLATLYRRYAVALEGKTPATPALIDEATALGTELLTLIKPMSVKKDAPLPEALQTAAERRNRMWTLLNQSHERLWQAGALLYGKQVETYVPALQARQP